MAKRTTPQLGKRISRDERESDPVEVTESTNAADLEVQAPKAVTGSKAGRPAGSKNRDYDTGERFPGICNRCKCTDSKAERRRVVKLTNDPDFSHVTIIRCQCVKCGQWRVDRQKCNPAAAE